MSNPNPESQENKAPEQTSDPLMKDNFDLRTAIQKIKEWRKRPFEMTDFPALIQAMFSEDELQNFYGVIGIRKLLSIEDAPPIQKVIDANLIPKLIEFMQHDSNPDLQIQATWALANLAHSTTEQAQYLIDKGALPIFVKLLSSPNPDVIEQAISGITNMAAISASIRDIVIDSGALEPLLYLVNHSIDDEIIKTAIQAITTLCRGKPPPNFEVVKSAMPTLCRIIINNTDSITLQHASTGLSILTSKSYHEIDDDLAKQLTPCLVKYIDNPNIRLSRACLVTLANLGMSDTNQEIALVDPTYLPQLFKLTCGLNRDICRAALRVISDITAGHSNLIQTVMGDHYYVDMLIKFAISNDTEVQFEATFALANATLESTSKQIAEMLDLGMLDCLLHLLDSQNTDLINVAVQGLLNILNKGVQQDQVGRVKNEFLDILIDKGGDKKIEELQTHPDEKISSFAVEIIERYF